MRGLGYWFFYGIDRIGHWTDASVPYTQDLWLLVRELRRCRSWRCCRRACVRWRHRAYFVLLTVIGVAVAVGANPYDDPSAARRPVQVVRGVVELRARVAQHEPGGAAGRARAGGAARRGGERAGARGCRAEAPQCAGVRCATFVVAGVRDRARDRQPARALDRRLLHPGPHPRRGRPAVLDRRHRRARRAVARHPGARDPRRRLRRLPLGPDRRPDHARAHGPAVRRARAGAVGIGGVGRPAERARPAACRRASLDAVGASRRSPG